MEINAIFDGIGTEVISIVISLVIGGLCGGAVGYKIGVKRNLRQKQTAGDESDQKQELRLDEKNIVNGSFERKEKSSQYQEAGNKSKQIQIVSVLTQQNQKGANIIDREGN